LANGSKGDKGRIFKQSQNAKTTPGLKYQLVNCFVRT